VPFDTFHGRPNASARLPGDVVGGCARTPLDTFLYEPFATIVSPIQNIYGKKTKMYQIIGLAVNSSRDIYVSESAARIFEYAAGASGNVAPVHVIKGSKTGLDMPGNIADTIIR
jgi:hypothetical protein